MPETPQVAQPRLLEGGREHADQEVDSRVSAQAAVDPRISMVVAVLQGQSVESVAQEWDLDTSLVHRWVRDFLVAGSAMITNRPDPDSARQRDRFMAAFAHELRTPIAVAQGWAMMLADGDVPPDQVDASVAKLDDALARLAERTLDVELMASASLGRIRVSIEPVLLSDVCAGLGDALPGYDGVRSGEDLTIHADPRLISRVVRDLWATAKRDPAPDRVSIGVVPTGSWHEIRVVREGEAIGPMILKALFDPFGTNDDATGVTIGLYLARALTVAHGGIVGAEGDENGTVLTARLPIVTDDDSTTPEPSGPGAHKEEHP